MLLLLPVLKSKREREAKLNLNGSTTQTDSNYSETTKRERENITHRQTLRERRRHQYYRPH